MRNSTQKAIITLEVMILCPSFIDTLNTCCIATPSI